MQVADDLPYQDKGALFLASRERAGLFDEPGLGKSRQAIMAMDRLALRRGLIVCPAGVRSTWAGEFKKWAKVKRRVIKGLSINDLALWLKGKVDVLILSYEMANTWAKRIEGDVFEFMVLDECHYLKSMSAARTKAILGAHCDGKHGLARWSASAWFLSGTPAPNDPSDAWSVARFCQATPLTHKIFTDRYFTKTQGTFSASYDPREEKVAEFKQMMASFSLQRTRREVNIQLPPIWLTTTMVDGRSDELLELLRNHPGLEKAIMEAVDRGGLNFIEAPHIMTMRRLIGEAKAPAFASWLIEEMKNGLQKVGVFGIHKRALSHIHSELQREQIPVYRFDGATSERDRGRHVERFRLDAGQGVFLANIKAGGTGVDGLQEACHDVIMFEQEWSPAANAQAIYRYHRMGQTEAVHARFIVLQDSIDERVMEKVERKTQNLIKLGVFSGVGA